MPEPTRILSIDPGSERSAWVVLAGDRLVNFGIDPNEKLLAALRGQIPGHLVVIERIESYGMPVGLEVFETVRWSGRFEEAAAAPVVYLSRRAVKLHLCQSPRANDAAIRQALIDRFGGTGGKRAAVGLKASPGPLYGVSRDVWQALAVGVAYADGARS
jgi:hypothetical protein